MKKQYIWLAVLVAGGLGWAGCSTNRPEPSLANRHQLSYVRGDMVVILNGSVSRIVKATQAALKDLSCVIVSSERNSSAARISARGMGEKPIQIDLTRQSSSATEVRIRVGTTGDDAISRLIQAKIEANL